MIAYTSFKLLVLYGYTSSFVLCQHSLLCTFVLIYPISDYRINHCPTFHSSKKKKEEKKKKKKPHNRKVSAAQPVHIFSDLTSHKKAAFQNDNFI